METNNSIVQFMGWCGADASNASFMINRIALPHDTVKLLVAFEGDHYRWRALVRDLCYDTAGTTNPFV